jgi:hypothetical protein
MSRPVNLRELSSDLQKRLIGSKQSVSARKAWQRRKKKAAKGHTHDEAASQFRLLCKASGLPMPVTEYVFAPPRKWRWDYAWPEEKIALEVDGGIFTHGAHVRGARILLTHEKLNAAACLNWRILYRVPRNLCTDETITILRGVLTELNGNVP